MRISIEHFNIGVVERVVQGVPFLALAVSDANGVMLGQITVHSTVLPEPVLDRPQEVLMLRGT